MSPRFERIQPEDKDNRRARLERNPGMHSENLFDQDEDQAGEHSNLATGEKFNNSTYTGMEEFSVTAPSEESPDALGEIPEEEDEAARWLKRHGQETAS